MPYARVKNELPIIPGYASGDIVMIDAAAAPLNKCVVDILPVQSGTGDPSPTNIRPISGWSSVNVTVNDGQNPPVIENVTTIPLGSTYYGGSLEVETGVLTVDMIMEQMLYSEVSSLSSDYIGYDSTRNAVWVRNWHLQDMKRPTQGGINACCNAYRIVAMDSGIISTQYRIYFFSPSSVQDFLDEIQTLEQGGSGLYICYELETPTTVQLTPTEVKTILGNNNIFADSGEVDIIYIRRSGT